MQTDQFSSLITTITGINDIAAIIAWIVSCGGSPAHPANQNDGIVLSNDFSHFNRIHFRVAAC